VFVGKTGKYKKCHFGGLYANSQILFSSYSGIAKGFAGGGGVQIRERVSKSSRTFGCPGSISASG